MNTTRRPRRPSAALHEVPGFLRALRLAMEEWDGVPREAWVAAARQRDAMYTAFARGHGVLTPGHVADAALTVLRLGELAELATPRRAPRRPPRPAVLPLGAA